MILVLRNVFFTYVLNNILGIKGMARYNIGNDDDYINVFDLPKTINK